MTSDKRGLPGSAASAAYVSVAAIVAFWVYRLVISLDGGGNPAGMSLPAAMQRVLISNTLIIVAIVVLMKVERDGHESLGFSTDRFLRHSGVGVLLGITMLVLGQAVVAPVVGLFVAGAPSVTIAAWFQDLSYVPMWVVMVLYGGGLGEELTRVFALTRFEKLWGRPGLAVAIVAHAVYFGAAHLYQGPQVAIGLAIQNVVYSLVFVRRRSAIELVVAHVTFDAIGVTIGFLTLYR